MEKNANMRVAVITIYDLMNYGNRLQNYAVIHYLQKQNIKADTIVLDYNTALGKIKRYIKKLLNKPIYVNWSLQQEREEFVRQLSEHEKVKHEKFKDFSYKYTNIQHKSYIKPGDNHWTNDYDYFIVGSDQVWNPQIDQAKTWEFLCFAPRGKRISWAASFGVNEIVNPSRTLIEGLAGMDYISVREESGKKIVSEISKKEAITLVDPTLMLDASEWNKISQKPSSLCNDEKYILMFFLGKTSDIAKQLALDIADKNGYKVIDLLDESSAVYESDPSEFLYLISHAKLVLTDSFHACVFSFLFNKPFYVYDRNWKHGSMNSRLETLLKKFHLERKYANSGLENDIWEHNYKDGYKQLELERQKATDFLKKALDC